MPRILLVEDDVDAREVMGLMLAAYEIEAVSGVGEALSAVTAQRPDLIVTDLRLGDDSGMALVEALKERGLQIPTLVVTGFVEAGQEPAGMIKAFLSKPFQSSELRDLVAQVLEGTAG